MRLRPPAVLKVTLKNAYPRCIVTRRISVDSTGTPSAGTYYGPYPSRKYALAFAERVLDFFKVRRCQIKIRRDPTFPGCLYSEMKMCLAPCFAGCSKEEYDAEVTRLVQFLDTDGNSLRAAIELEREKASDDLDFERAATIHKRIEKLDDALRGKPDLARRIQDLNAVVLQRSAEDQTIAAFAIRGGRFSDPCYIRFAEIAGQPRSAEQIFRNYLESSANEDSTAESAPPAPAASRTELGEHLWLLARWYYSNPRDGEIFFHEKDWPYRRILRACSRLLLPKEVEADKTKNPDAANNQQSDATNNLDQGKNSQ
jgi:excinuclease UvrABC nuclease subunit